MTRMANVTILLNANETELRFSFSGITVLRVNALLIFIENAVVAICLYSHRKMFSKKEFWLQLVCLTMNDLFVSVVLFQWSFINYDVFNKTYIGCASLGVLVVISQLGLLYTVLSICVYRFMFLVCTDRFRFGWKTKMTIFQMIGVYLFSTLYVITPILVWGKPDMTVNRCTEEILFGNDKQKAFAFLGTGLFIPLIFLNVLYCVTFFLLKRHLRKRQVIEQLTKTSQTRLSQENKETEQDIQHREGRCKCDSHRCCKCDNSSSNKTGSSSSNKTGSRSSSSSKPLVPIFREPFDDEISLNQDNNIHSSRKHKCAHELKYSYSNYNLLKKEEYGIYVSENADEIRCALQKTPRQRVLSRISPPAKDAAVCRSSVRDSQRQSLCLIGLILLLIDLSTLPCVIYLIAEKVFPPDSIPGVVKALLCLMIMNNSLLNPWIYAVQSKEFRGALVSNIKNLFCHSECFDMLCKDEL